MELFTNPSNAAGQQALGRMWIPEELTPLSFTSIYARLSDAQRLRYNQLHGLYFLEQVVFFEQYMGRPGLERLLKIAPPGQLKSDIADFIAEENRHSEWFRRFLNQAEPSWYFPGSDFYFLKVPRPLRAGMGFCARRPWLFPCLLWLQIIAEERAMHFSGIFLKNADGLEAGLVEIQRKHLADEAGHVLWDVALIEWRWPAAPALLRKLNARLLGWLLREFFYLPKRSGLNVVAQLIVEFPELQSERVSLYKAMKSLAQNSSYIESLYPRSILPRTRRLAARWRELDFLETFFTG